MKFDVYADLASLQACPTNSPLPCGLVSGFVDGCTAFAAGADDARADDARKEARRCYSQRAAAGELRLPPELRLDAEMEKPLREGWVAIEIAFTLCAPWYSKDDSPFHVLDNPVRKDRVFGVPYMSAASWKGLLRWACRMGAGLHDSAWIVHLFGNEKGKKRNFQRGALAFYPTWFPKIGFELINPHDRKTRAGKQPITYEVVPPGTDGRLHLLYAPTPGAAARDDVSAIDTLRQLLDAAEQLLTVYGFSAKRTAGWGVAKVKEARASGRAREQKGSIADLKKALGTLLAVEETRG